MSLAKWKLHEVLILRAFNKSCELSGNKITTIKNKYLDDFASMSISAGGFFIQKIYFKQTSEKGV